MVYFTDIYSVIESIYLEEPIKEKVGPCNIFINPDSTSYIVGKVVIINKLDYPDEKIDALLSNRCEVITRVCTDRTDIKFQPYIIYPNFNIMWNGDTIELVSDLLRNCSFDKDRQKLLFPKIKVDISRVDEEGNLTALGWALHQVGLNIIKDTKFKDLDVIKTKKMRL